MRKGLVFAIALLLSSSAQAFEVNFDVPIKNIDGETNYKDEFEQGKDLTAKWAAIHALVVTNTPSESPPNGQPASGDEKFKRWELATKIMNTPKVDLSIDDAKRVKEAIGRLYGPIVVGQLYVILKEPTAKQ